MTAERTPDAPPRDREEERAFSEERGSLWRITLGPAVWALHFLISYGATAVFCAKFATDAASIAGFRLAVLALGLAAEAVILWIGWRAWRQWDYLASRDYENALGENEDRHQFLGHAAFLLAIVSFLGVLYTAFPIIFIESCR